MVLHILFLSNLVFIYFPQHYIGHYWSLALEEQFYLFWPHTVKWIKNILVFLIAFIIGILIIKIFVNRVYGGWSSEYTIAYGIRFDCMAIGGLGAYLFVHHGERLKFINHITIQLIPWVVIFLITIQKFRMFSIIEHQFIACCTLIIILNHVNHERPLVNIENPFFDFIGKISYGIYVYHPSVIWVGYWVIEQTNYSLWIEVPTLFLSVFVITVIISYLSYTFFESPFLKLKDKFSVVMSKHSSKG